MKLRDVRNRKTPPLMIIPMIDIMFFLLVFFMLSTMYMIDLKTIPVKLPQAKNAATDITTTFAVTMKADGSIYLGDAKTDAEALALQAGMEQKKNKNFAVVIRAEKALEYGEVIKLVVWRRMAVSNNEADRKAAGEGTSALWLLRFADNTFYIVRRVGVFGHFRYAAACCGC